MSVGVIVPVRAPAPWLGEALAAIRAQEPAPDRLVVVDDGSEPALVVAGPVELIRRDRSGGPATARQAGLDALGESVELIALCDADDRWCPGKLAAQLAALDAHPDAALCVGRARVVGSAGVPTGEAWEPLAPGRHEPARLARTVYERNPVATSAVVVRAEALRAVGGFQTDVPPPCEDADTWLRLLAAGHPAVSEPAAEVAYRRHPGGLTADIAALAEAQLALHERHAGLVDAGTRVQAEARDLRALARGRATQRRYGEAREALRRAAGVSAPSPADRAYAVALALPGLRAALGRRAPYRA